jgi:hypothetical protein
MDLLGTVIESLCPTVDVVNNQVLAKVLADAQDLYQFE